MKERVRKLSKRIETDQINRKLEKRNRPITEKLEEALREVRHANRFIDIEAAQDEAASSKARVQNLVSTPLSVDYHSLGGSR